jgi:hypothetical protein
MEFLLIGGKDECLTAVRTLQCFVCKSHWMTSFPIILGLSFGHPTVANGPRRALTETR